MLLAAKTQEIEGQEGDEADVEDDPDGNRIHALSSPNGEQTGTSGPAILSQGVRRRGEAERGAPSPGGGARRSRGSDPRDDPGDPPYRG